MIDQAVEEFLGEVRSREQPHSAGLVSQPTAVKFLMARKFDVSRAIELFQAYKVLQHCGDNSECHSLFLLAIEGLKVKGKYFLLLPCLGVTVVILIWNIYSALFGDHFHETSC